MQDSSSFIVINGVKYEAIVSASTCEEANLCDECEFGDLADGYEITCPCYVFQSFDVSKRDFYMKKIN